MSELVFEPLLPQLHELAEGPVWSEAEQALWWVDIPGLRIHRLDWRTHTERSWACPSEPGSLAPANDGSAVVALRDGFHRFDPATGVFTRLAGPEHDTSAMRFNDGRCDRQGRFWAGTMDTTRSSPRGGLWCLDSGRLRAGPQGVTIANGLAWSPDSRTMYWADSVTQIVQRFAFDPTTGCVERPEPWFRCEEGAPDGASVDAEGFYWLAVYGAGLVLRLDPDGRVERRVAVPAACPTMVGFAGPHLDLLVVTTGKRNRPAEELARWPLSGAVLIAHAGGIRGLPEMRYRP